MMELEVHGRLKGGQRGSWFLGVWQVCWQSFKGKAGRKEMDLINGDLFGEDRGGALKRETERGGGHLHSKLPACGPQDREHPGEPQGGCC